MVVGWSARAPRLSFALDRIPVDSPSNSCISASRSISSSFIASISRSASLSNSSSSSGLDSPGRIACLCAFFPIVPVLCYNLGDLSASVTEGRLVTHFDSPSSCWRSDRPKGAQATAVRETAIAADRRHFECDALVPSGRAPPTPALRRTLPPGGDVLSSCRAHHARCRGWARVRRRVTSYWPGRAVILWTLCSRLCDYSGEDKTEATS